MERDQIVSKVVVFCSCFEVVLLVGKVKALKEVVNAFLFLLKFAPLAHYE